MSSWRNIGAWLRLSKRAQEHGEEAPASEWMTTVRAALAGSSAQAVAASAQRLFAVTGERWISIEARTAMQSAAHHMSGRLVASTPHLGRALRVVESDTTKALVGKVRASLPRTSSALLDSAESGAIAATRAVLGGAARAGGLGFVVDGAFAGVRSIRAVQRGEMTSQEAVFYTVQEGAKGAVATATGVLATGAVVALTGGLAAPALFVIGAATAMGTRSALDRFSFSRAATETEADEDGEIRVLEAKNRTLGDHQDAESSFGEHQDAESSLGGHQDAESSLGDSD